MPLDDIVAQDTPEDALGHNHAYAADFFIFLKVLYTDIARSEFSKCLMKKMKKKKASGVGARDPITLITKKHSIHEQYFRIFYANYPYWKGDLDILGSYLLLNHTQVKLECL